MKVAIVKYNAGNTESVRNALNRLGIEPEVTDHADALSTADKVIFPGVGEASTAMNYLRQRKLDDVIRGLRQPVLGICLGMQLLCDYSNENETECLGIVKASVHRFPDQSVKVPQIGWNRISGLKGKLFNGIPEASFMYFVHGYYVEVVAETSASASYGTLFSAALHQDNFYATQFHPEKSGAPGAQLLENFLNI
jgi:glutamine amidotransferase